MLTKNGTIKLKINCPLHLRSLLLEEEVGSPYLTYNVCYNSFIFNTRVLK